MAKSKKRLANLKLSHSDFDAILCALPLISWYEADTPLQSQINALLCDTASQKIMQGVKDFSPDETRVIAAAISLAKFLLSGESDPNCPAVDSEWRADLCKYLFAYNRLDPIFQEIVDLYSAQG